MSSKKILFEATLADFIAATSSLLAGAHGNVELAEAILINACLPIPPDFLVAVWHEVVSGKFAGSPQGRFMVERVTAYDDGSTVAMCRNITVGGTSSQRDPTVYGNRPRFDVNLN